MPQMKHSEIAAKLAIDGVVAAIGEVVQGELGLRPRQLRDAEKVDLAMLSVGTTLFYEADNGGVFFHADGAFTTIWYNGADVANGASALDAALKRRFPEAKSVSDGPHPTERNFDQRVYDVRLPNGRLAIVEAIYPVARVDNPKFMVRVTAMEQKQAKN
ncbi:MAG: hypothetical protein AB7O98_10020 [Hyphomonadaceae bacterium]